MIRRIQALRFLSLRSVDEEIDNFQILVGPNASGKSSFLDVVSFLGDLVRVGPVRAILGDLRAGVPPRAPDPRDLARMRDGDSFQVAVEATIPAERLSMLPRSSAASTLHSCVC